MHIFEIMHPQALKNDEQIRALIQKKDRRGLELLYDTYGAALYGMILRWVHHTNIADKVLAGTLASVSSHIDCFQPDYSSLFTWVLNIARSLAKDDIFAACNTAGDKDNNCIFDKVVGQGLSLQAASKLLDLSPPMCAHNLRTKINNLRNNNT